MVCVFWAVTYARNLLAWGAFRQRGFMPARQSSSTAARLDAKAGAHVGANDAQEVLSWGGGWGKQRQVL